MRLLHTSDWHIGHQLMDRSRADEYRNFFAWLLRVLREQRADALLISGDIFDSGTPSAEAQSLYSDFLSRVDATGCRQVVLTAGNHDSMARLESNAPFLHRYHAKLVTQLDTGNAAECLIPLTDAEGREQVLVCAVPFLRTEVARRVSADDETARANAYTDGMSNVYAAVAHEAAAWKARTGGRVVSMGHLTVQGSEPTASTRRCIGYLDAVGPSAFPEVFDYVALGHIHKPWSTAGGRIRYCGSPLPMATDEAQYPHHVLLLDTETMAVQPIEVPAFVLPLHRVCSSVSALEALPAELAELSAARGGAPIWLEVEYSGADLSRPALQEKLEHLLDSGLVPYWRARKTLQPVGMQQRPAAESGEEAQSLSDYSPEAVFDMRLADFERRNAALTEEQREMLRRLFAELLAEDEEN